MATRKQGSQDSAQAKLAEVERKRAEAREHARALLNGGGADDGDAAGIKRSDSAAGVGGIVGAGARALFRSKELDWVERLFTCGHPG